MSRMVLLQKIIIIFSILYSSHAFVEKRVSERRLSSRRLRRKKGRVKIK